MKAQPLRAKNEAVSPRGKGKDVAVSRFLQGLVLKWEAAGRPLKDLAEKAGVSPSLVTQIKTRGEGVGVDSGPRLAEALGFSFPTLWQLAHGAPLCRTHPDWERIVAEAEKSGVPRATIDRIGDTIPPMGFGLDDLTAGVVVDLARALVAVDAARQQRETKRSANRG